MKHKFLSFALTAAVGSSMLFSCQNSEEPTPAMEENRDEMVEYTITAQVPDEIRTRAAASASIGESGLYEFENRTIDKLWYVVDYNGTVMETNSLERNDSNPFLVTYRMEGNSDPSKLHFFFWAGSKDDDVQFITTEKSQGLININAKSFFVLLDNKKFLSTELKIYDSFAGYYQFAESNDNSVRTKTITLKRPFAEIHVIADDFADTDLKEDYQDGFRAYYGFGSSQSQLNLPNRWNYLDKTYSLEDSRSIFFYNALDGESISQVTFKERQMDYYTLFYSFPITTDELTYLNVNVYPGNQASSGKKSFSIQLPEDGIKANTKYVIYNKRRSEGGTGFLEGVYNYKILADNDFDWESTEQSENGVDRVN